MTGAPPAANPSVKAAAAGAAGAGPEAVPTDTDWNDYYEQLKSYFQVNYGEHWEAYYDQEVKRITEGNDQ